MNRINQIGIDKSELFLAIITDNFYEDMEPLECFLYAKNRNKPMILLIKEGTKEAIPDLFLNCNILDKIYFTDPLDMTRKLKESSKKWGDYNK